MSGKKRIYYHSTDAMNKETAINKIIKTTKKKRNDIIRK
jgi:hypothetical protein